MPKEAFRTFRNISVLFGGTFAFIIGIIAIILLEKGLTLAEVGFYFALYSVSLLLLEVPTGAFADAYGRKKAIMIGFVFEVAFLVGLLLLPGGDILLPFAFVMALGDSMMSGSSEAYVVDMLSEKGKMDYTHKLLTSGVWWKHITFLLGSIVGGYVATFSVDYAIYICIAFSLAGFLYSAVRLTERKTGEDFETAEKRMTTKITKTVKQSMKNQALFTIHLLSLLLGLGTFGFFSYWQPIMQETAGWNTDLLGVFFSVISISMIMGSEISPHMKTKWSTVILIFIGMAAFLFGASYVAIPMVMAGLIILWEFLWGMYIPLEGAIINHNTPSELRATAISVKAMAYRAGWALFGVLIFFAGAEQPRFLWTLGAAFLMIGALFVLIKKPKDFRS